MEFPGTLFRDAGPGCLLCGPCVETLARSAVARSALRVGCCHRGSARGWAVLFGIGPSFTAHAEVPARVPSLPERRGAHRQTVEPSAARTSAQAGKLRPMSFRKPWGLRVKAKGSALP